jgi:hypothetical protein
MKATISTLSNYELLTTASGTKAITGKTGKAILAQVVLACLMPLTMWAQNLLPNPGFEIPAPGVPPGTPVSYTNYCGGTATSAAADWVVSVDVCGGNLTTTLVPSTAPHGGKYMVHIVTDSVNSGIAQSEGFADQAKVLSSVWVYVNSGCVGIGTGNAAFTVDTDEITCETGTWIQFKVPNSGSPANTFVVYAFPLTGADFYVDNARVVAVP